MTKLSASITEASAALDAARGRASIRTADGRTWITDGAASVVTSREPKRAPPISAEDWKRHERLVSRRPKQEGRPGRRYGRPALRAVDINGVAYRYEYVRHLQDLFPRGRWFSASKARVAARILGREVTASAAHLVVDGVTVAILAPLQPGSVQRPA